MEFRIADTFQVSLARLTADEQKSVKTTVYDLQVDPSNPGLQFHRVDRAKDPDFWVVRASRDIRVIVHMTESSLLICYAAHHDPAYDWAERRRLETHPKTGAMQLVEVRETVKEVVIPKYTEVEQPKPLLFAKLSDDELLSYGVPVDWLSDVRLATEDSLFKVTDHLPGEAAEALLEVATGGKPQLTPPVPPGTDPFDHPDASRRFRTMNDMEELKLALDYPWERWTVFLHPAQRQWVERDYNGPARVSGSAGTGKTVVALHRAAHLARANPDAKILLATFSDALANALRRQLGILLSSEPRVGEWLEVHAMDAIGKRLYEDRFGAPVFASREVIQELLLEAGAPVDGGKVSVRSQIQTLLSEDAPQAEGFKFSLRFLMTEWEQVVDAWQLDSWEKYRDVRRLGRKIRLPEPQRVALWEVFSTVRSKLKARGLVTYPQIFARLTALYTNEAPSPYDFVVLDEAQDVSVAQLRFLAALAGDKPSGLFFSGDLGQRIFQQPFSWKALGVNIMGRSRTLRVNYRTSHQIRSQADRLLGPEIADVDGNTEERRGTVSVFNGPEPEIRVLDTADEEAEHVAEWLSARRAEGLEPHEMGIFVRSEAELERAATAVGAAGLVHRVLDEDVETTEGQVSVSTMHLAKGLEFRAVVVMACDDEVIPLQERIETAADDVDLGEVYDTERHLLYVACTRARDHLLVTGAAPASEFLDDLRTPAPSRVAEAD